MTPRSQTANPALTRAALAGLGVGAAVSSLLGVRFFAGFAAVALAAGVMMALGALGAPGMFLSSIAAALVMLFPLAAAEQGDAGILWAAGITFIVLSAGYVARGLHPHSLLMLSESLMAVVHLGLAGSYLVLVVELGNRLLIALVLMLAVYEAAYGLLTLRQTAGAVPPPPAGPKAQKRPAGTAVSGRISPGAAFGGVVACQAAALLARFFLPSPLEVLSLLILGTVVGAAATLGHAGAALVVDDLGWERGHRGGLDPGLFGSLNALLLAAGAFYYGFSLYLS